MRILLFGYPDSVHIYHYVKQILLPMQCEITILAPSDATIYREFYQINNVRVIVFDLDSKRLIFSKAYSLVFILRLTRMVRSLGRFNYCHIHMYSPYYLLIALLSGKAVGKVVVSFWGSDLFRKKRASWPDRLLLHRPAQAITLSTMAMFDHFHRLFGMGYDGKLHNIKFGVPTLEDIDAITHLETKDKIKRLFTIPADKITVVCGYNGSLIQQHEAILQALSSCSPEMKARMYLILPMGYGVEQFDYPERMERCMKQFGLQGRVLTHFLHQHEVAKLRVLGDIFINVQKRDAFSSSMQEALYAGAHVINGGWLDYRDLDIAGAYYYKVENIVDLPKVLNLILANPRKEEALLRNRKIINELSSWNVVSAKWQGLYK